MRPEARIRTASVQQVYCTHCRGRVQPVGPADRAVHVFVVSGSGVQEIGEVPAWVRLCSMNALLKLQAYATAETA